MAFEIQIHDGEEENEENLDYFISGAHYGDLTESHERRIARLFQQLEDRLLRLEEGVSESQRSSRVRSEECNRAARDLQRVEKLSQSINDALRNWRIDLAGSPMEYRESKDVLEGYLARQKSSIDKIGHASRKVQDLLSRQTTEGGGSGVQYGRFDDFSGDSVRSYSYHIPSCEDSPYEIQAEDGAFGRRSQQEELPYKSATIQCAQQTFDIVDRQIAQETAIGLGHIQSQMYEANQIFKNLASMVNEQGETIQNLETTIDNTVYNAKQAVGELRKAYNSRSYKFSLLANYGLPGFLLLVLSLILALYFLHII